MLEHFVKDDLIFGFRAIAEYDFIGLQNQTLGLPSTAPLPFTNDTITVNNRSIQMVTAGVNYKLYGPGAW